MNGPGRPASGAAQLQTYLVLLLGNIGSVSISVFGKLEAAFQMSVKLSHALVEIALQLSRDRQMLDAVLVQVGVLQGLLDVTLGKLLQSRLKGMGNSLIIGLELALALVGGLDA